MSLLTCQELANKFLTTSPPNSSNIYRYFTRDSRGDVGSIFESFYQIFYSNGYNYDISGYSLIFFYPPDLSGIGLHPEETLSSSFRDFMTLAVDVTPIGFSMSATEIPIGATNYSLPNFLTKSGELSITFLDTDDVRLYTYHLTWLDYIRSVLMGDVNPSDNYINENKIDYLGSVYIIKYDADMTTPRLIGKAYGIYPTGINGKETFGNRAEYQLSMINISYNTLLYAEEPILNMSSGLYAEFNSKIGRLYEQ